MAEIKVGEYVLKLDDEDAQRFLNVPLTVSFGRYVRCGRRAVHFLVVDAPAGYTVRAVNDDLFDCRKSNLLVLRPGETMERLLQKRADHLEALAAAKAAAKGLLQPPTELGTWGCLRTRCWERISRDLRSAAHSTQPSLARLNRAIHSIQELPTWTTEQCAAFLDRRLSA